MKKSIKKFKRSTTKALKTVGSGATTLADGVSNIMVDTGVVVGRTLGAVVAGVSHGVYYGRASGSFQAIRNFLW